MTFFAQSTSQQLVTQLGLPGVPPGYQDGFNIFLGDIPSCDAVILKVIVKRFENVAAQREISVRSEVFSNGQALAFLPFPDATSYTLHLDEAVFYEVKENA